MANLLVHAAVGAAAGIPLARREDRLVLLVGNLLPDVAFKAMYFVGGAQPSFCEPSHMPLVLPLFAMLAAMAFEPAYRRRAFWLLWAGSALHVLLDAGKDYAQAGVIFWAFPFWLDRWQWTLYDAIPWWATYPLALALWALAMGTQRALRRRRSIPQEPEAAEGG